MSSQSLMIFMALLVCFHVFPVNALVAPLTTQCKFAMNTSNQNRAGAFRNTNWSSTRKITKHETTTTLSLSPNALALAQTLAPSIGVFTSIALYFSPAAAVSTAVRTDSLGDLNPLPLAVMSVSGIAWLVYGLSVRDPFMTACNSVGSIASLSYVVGVLPLIRERKRLRLTQWVVISGATTLLGLWSYLALSYTSMSKISSSLGLFASGLFCILSASPLSTMRSVIRTKNASSILAPFTAAQVFNCALWSAYGLAIGDRFVWGPNVVGLGLGFAQLALKLLFPSDKQ